MNCVLAPTSSIQLAVATKDIGVVTTVSFSDKPKHFKTDKSAELPFTTEVQYFVLNFF